MLANKGLNVPFQGDYRHFTVAIVAFLADTLAAHALGECKGSMSFAHRICCSCMATTDRIQSCFLESNFELRTAEKHRRQVEEVSSSYSEKSV